LENVKMVRRLRLLVSAIALALLVVPSSAEAGLLHKRKGHKPLPTGNTLCACAEKEVKKAFPNGKVTACWSDGKGEVEVLVSVPGSGPIEVVFHKKGNTCVLVGYEYPVPAAALTPRALAKLKAGHPHCTIVEVEMLFDKSWKFLGYQVTMKCGSKFVEVFVTAG
jgi:hypothetical protein